MDVDVLISSLPKEERITLAPYMKLRAEYFSLFSKRINLLLKKYSGRKTEKLLTKQNSETDFDKLIKKNVTKTLRFIEKVINKYPYREYPLVLKANVLVTHPLNQEMFLEGKKILLKLIRKKSKNPVVYELYIGLIAQIGKRRFLLKKYSDRLSVNVRKDILKSIKKYENELIQKKKEEEIKKFDKMCDQFIYLVGKKEIERQSVKLNEEYKKCIRTIDALIKKYPGDNFRDRKYFLQSVAYGKVSISKSHIKELKRYLIRKLKTTEDNHLKKVYLNIIIDSKSKNKKKVLKKYKDIFFPTEYKLCLEKINNQSK